MISRDPARPARALSRDGLDLHLHVDAFPHALRDHAELLIVIAYGPTLVRLVATTLLTTPGLRVW